MIKFLWLLCAVLLVFSIMIHNPKSQGVGGQNQLFTSTRSAEANLNKITWILILAFFSLTTYLSIYTDIN
jgi:preprotein translocase subunit SecG